MFEELNAMVDQFIFGETTREKKTISRLSISIEAGRGQTYRNNSPTVYGHSTYSRSSVLAGQPKRCWIGTLAKWEDVEPFIAQLKTRQPKLRVEQFAGSSHIDVETICDRAGLPHDEDY